MDCTMHTVGVSWTRHAWDRRVTRTETLTFSKSDQWGRIVPTEHVLCHSEYVCRACGTIRDGGACTCEPERAERCQDRLAWLTEAAQGRTRL